MRRDVRPCLLVCTVFSSKKPERHLRASRDLICAATSIKWFFVPERHPQKALCRTPPPSLPTQETASVTSTPYSRDPWSRLFSWPEILRFERLRVNAQGQCLDIFMVSDDVVSHQQTHAMHWCTGATCAFWSFFVNWPPESIKWIITWNHVRTSSWRGTLFNLSEVS